MPKDQAKTRDAQQSEFAVEGTYLDLALLIYFYLYSDLNRQYEKSDANKDLTLSPGIAIVGQILREMTYGRINNKHRQKIRRDLMAKSYVMGAGIAPTTKKDRIDVGGYARLEELGLIDAAERGQSFLCEELLLVIHQYANDIRLQSSPDFDCEEQSEYSIMYRDYISFEVGKKATKEVARFEITALLEGSAEEAGPIPRRTLEELEQLKPIFFSNATPQEIGERIRAYREARGLSQLELAIRMGHKSKGSVQKLEAGRDGVTVMAITNAMKALEINKL